MSSSDQRQASLGSLVITGFGPVKPKLVSIHETAQKLFQFRADNLILVFGGL
jgi:hypothetical protein